MSIHIKTQEIKELLDADPSKIHDVIDDVMRPNAYSYRWDILFHLIRCNVEETLVYKVFYYYTKHDAKVLEFLKTDSIAMEYIHRLAIAIKQSEYNYYDISNWIFKKTYMNSFPYSFVSVFPKIVNEQISINDCRYVRQDIDYILSCIRGNLVTNDAITYFVEHYLLDYNDTHFSTCMLNLTDSPYLTDDQKIDIVTQFQRQRNKNKLTGKYYDNAYTISNVL